MIWGTRASIEQTLPSHAHDVHEFIVCESDTGALSIAQEVLPFRVGKTFFIPGGITHSIVAHGDAPARSLFVCFDQISFMEYVQPSLHPVLDELIAVRRFSACWEEAAASRNAAVARRLEEELDAKAPLGQSAVGSLLGLLLVNHSRGSEGSGAGVDSDHRRQISQVVAFIREHLDAEVTLDCMARRARMSRTLFSQKFRAATGTSLIEFTMTVRVEAAARRLEKTDDSVAEIALACGFGNLGHFHKTFKRRYGITPSQYRRTVMEHGSFVTESGSLAPDAMAGC